MNATDEPSVRTSRNVIMVGHPRYTESYGAGPCEFGLSPAGARNLANRLLQAAADTAGAIISDETAPDRVYETVAGVQDASA